jgi:hypothetical protein
MISSANRTVNTSINQSIRSRGQNSSGNLSTRYALQQLDKITANNRRCTHGISTADEAYSSVLALVIDETNCTNANVCSCCNCMHAAGFTMAIVQLSQFNGAERTNILHPQPE